MSRLLRWPTIVSRLMLVAIAILAVQFALGRAARTISLHSGDSAAEVRAQSSHASVSLGKRQLVLNNVRIESGQKPSSVHLEFDRSTFEFDVVPLMYRRAVVERGSVTGLRLGDLNATADSSTVAADDSTPATNWFNDDPSGKASQWLERLDKLFENDLLTELESVRRTEQLCTRWPRESAAIKQRLDDLTRRAAVLQEDVRTAQANPLRNVDFLSDLSATVAALDTDFARVGAEAQQLVDSIEADRRAIVASRPADEQLVSKRLQLEPIDANALTAYLLREQVGDRLTDVIGWLRWTRQMVPANVQCSCKPTRGVNVWFAGCRPSPSLLIRELQLQGAGRIAGQSLEFAGVLSNYSNAPALHTKPIELRLKATGSLPLDLQATVDRTGPVPRDELLVDCAGIVFPQMELGRKQQLSMSLAPSVGSVSISVAVQGDNLTGDIQLVQRQVHMQPALGGTLLNAPLAAPLSETLSKVDSLALRISLTGTLQDPKCTLWSNVGPAVAESMDRALQQSGEQHARLLHARAQQHVDERLASIERQAAEQQAAFTAERTAATTRLAQIARQQTPAKRLSRQQLGGQLPAGSLFR